MTNGVRLADEPAYLNGARARLATQVFNRCRPKPLSFIGASAEPDLRLECGSLPLKGTVHAFGNRSQMPAELESTETV